MVTTGKYFSRKTRNVYLTQKGDTFTSSLLLQIGVRMEED